MTNVEAQIDASSLSVVLPVRIDGPDRLQNLEASSRYVRAYFKGAEMVLVECDSDTKVPEGVKDRFEQAIFVPSTGPFSKAQCMNAGLLACTRPIIAFYDVDVLVHPAAMAWAIRMIRQERFPVALPFNGLFVDVRGRLRQGLIDNLEIGSLGREAIDAVNRRSDASARLVDGGVFLADRDVVTAEGGYNSRMISYGWEDIEVLLRLKKLGYHSVYARHNLIHLDHSRGPDSVRNEHFDRNRAEYLRVRSMSRAELRRYVDNELRLSDGADAYHARMAVRRRSSRPTFSPTALAALVTKIRSRLRHS